MADKPKRDSKGRILPGCSGNKTGRPKTAKLTAKDKKELKGLWKSLIKDKNAEPMVNWLSERANDTNEVFKYFKEVLPYTIAKKASIKTEVNQIKTVRISFVAAEKPKTIEGELVKEGIENDK